MPETNYNVKVLVDVQGRKVMDALAGGGGSGATKNGPKSLSGAMGAAQGSLMKGEGIGTVFETLTKSLTGLAAVVGIGVGVLLMAVSNSKILTTVFGTIGKLLGFLMDVILMPLMPIFMMLVRWLYQMIIAFRNFTKNLTLKSLLDFGVNLLLLTSPLGWVIKLIQWALGEGNITSAINFTLGILQGIGDWLWTIAKYVIVGNIKLAHDAIALMFNIGSTILGAFAGLASLVISILQYLWGVGAGPSITKIALDFIANPVGALWDLLMGIWNGGKSAWNTIANLSGGVLPTLDAGGTVMQTGIAVVHRGETFSGVRGSGQSAAGTGGGDTFNFYNYGQTKTEYELFLKFMEFMRVRGKGLTL
jgi:hypothetical protein